MPSHTLLVDGDLLAFRVAAANEEPTEWADDVWTLHSDAGVCKQQFDGEIAYLKQVLEADKAIICFSDEKKNRFREQLGTGYKSNRDGGRKPLAYWPLVAYIEEAYKTHRWFGLEGDDVLGILATQPHPESVTLTIVSDDKDLQTIPAQLYISGRLVEVTEDEANYFWMFQTLTGDRVDGYSGCPGCGPKTAEKVLDGMKMLDELWFAVVKEYERRGLHGRDALLNARMARILRHGDYDRQTGEVNLWTPEVLEWAD